MANSKPIIIEIGPGLSLITGLPVIACWTSKTRPKKPRRGTVGFNTQTSSLEYWDGKNWFQAAMHKE